MKTLLLVALVSVPLASRAEESATRTTHDALTLKIREAFPYVPPDRQKKEEKVESKSEVVMLERVTVVGSGQLRELREKIDADQERAKAEKFSVTKGGTILKKNIGRARIEIGAWGSASGLNILKVSW